MKLFLLLTPLIILPFLGVGQQLSTSLGRVSTIYDYLNSEGEGLGNLHSVSDFSLSIGFRKSIKNRIYITGSIVQNSYNNEGSDPILDNYYQWKTSYLGINLSPQYEFINSRKFKLSAQGNVSPQFMLKGIQTINNQIFSLKGVEQFNSPFLFVGGGLGFNYCLDEKVALSLSYSLNVGRPFSPSEDGEQLHFNTRTIMLGLLWGTKSCKYCTNRSFR